MNPNPTTFTELPTGLSNLMGVYDTGHWQTAVMEIKSGIGTLLRGTVLASGSGADIGKLVKLSASTEAAAYGVLLDEAVDTGVAYSDGSVTGSVARAGSFRGDALLVPTGVDAGLIAVALRGRGIFVEGPITVPAAAAVLEEEQTEDEGRRAEPEPYVASAESMARRQREEDEARRRGQK